MKRFSRSQMFGNLVYAAFDRHGRCLYVGRSFRGLSRPSTNPILRAHQGKISHIQIEWCNSEKQASKREIELIREYTPKFNKIRVGQNRKMKCYLLKLEDSMLEEWRASADAVDLPLAEWIRSRCNGE